LSLGAFQPCDATLWVFTLKVNQAHFVPNTNKDEVISDLRAVVMRKGFCFVKKADISVTAHKMPERWNGWSATGWKMHRSLRMGMSLPR
jgi:hypothetical protein